MISWDAVTALATVALAIGIPATLYVEGQARKNEMKRERYSEYTKRYQEIFTHLPYNIFVAGAELVDLKPDQKAWMVAYIDLCNEELFDFAYGTIDDKIWAEWSGSLRRAFDQGSPLKGIFDEVSKNYPSFNQYLKNPKMDKEKIRDSFEKTNSTDYQ